MTEALAEQQPFGFTACAQNKAWQDAGLGRLRVAVNLSARQFGEADLVAAIEANRSP